MHKFNNMRFSTTEIIENVWYFDFQSPKSQGYVTIACLQADKVVKLACFDFFGLTISAGIIDCMIPGMEKALRSGCQ